MYACVHLVLMQAALSLLSIDLAHFKKTYYLANNCVKALFLSRHVRVSTLGVFTKGLVLVLHPNIAFLQDVQKIAPNLCIDLAHFRKCAICQKYN